MNYKLFKAVASLKALSSSAFSNSYVHSPPQSMASFCTVKERSLQTSMMSDGRSKQRQTESREQIRAFPPFPSTSVSALQMV